MEDELRALSQLDESTQRRLILQAAKECGELAVSAVQRKQPTLRELNSEIWTHVGVSVFLLFTLIIPLLLLPLAAWPMYRTRRLLAANWRTYLEEPDPECYHRVLIRDVQRAAAALPRSARRLRKDVRRELRSIERVLADLRVRRERAEGALRLVELVPAPAVEAPSGSETDPILQTARLAHRDALQAHSTTRENLEIWRARLAATEQACAASLRELIGRLSLVTASGDERAGSALEETADSLHRINMDLRSAQSAAEEVLLLRS